MADDSEQLGYSKPEQKVQIAIDMTVGCMRICADGIKQFPEINDAELLGSLGKALLG